MGRTQGYDTDVVVSAARNLFWENGFAAVSVSDIERVTGISRSSLYHAFGSMRGLFDAAVQDYLDTVVRPRLEPLTRHEVAPHAIFDYLTGLTQRINELADDDLPTGCLLLGAVGSPLSTDPALREVIDVYYNELRTALHRGVRALHPHADAEQIAHTAQVVTGCVVAALSLARINRSEAATLITEARALLENFD